VYRDVLIGLSSIGGLSLPSSSRPITHKREWPDEVLDTRTQGTLEEALGEPRVIAGSQRSRAFSHIEAQPVLTQVTSSHFQQREPFHRLRPPLYDSSGHINYQSPASVSYLNLSLGSSTVAIAQHNRHMSSQGSSWLSPAAGSINPVSFFTYGKPSTRSPTQTRTQALTRMQTMAFNVPLNKETALSDSVQVMHDGPSEAQCRAVIQAQRWHDNSAPSVPSFEYSDWAGAGWTGGVPQFDPEYSKTSQLRQDQTGSRIGSQALLSQPQPQPQRQLPALPTLQPYVATHLQPQQLQSQRAPPLAQMRREEQAQLPPGFMEPLLDPKQHQPQQPQPPPHPQQQQLAFSQDDMQTWTSVPTMTSECVFLRPFTSRLRAYLYPQASQLVHVLTGIY